MVPIALGTQTRGSVLRPASYCGVTGFKASYGLLSMEGVLPLAKSLDTLGFFTNTPADMLALWESLGHSDGLTEDFALGAPEPMPDVEPQMAAAFKNALGVLGSVGISIRPLDISSMLAKLNDATSTVEFYEGARFHQQRFNEYGSRLADLADLVQGPPNPRGAIRRSPEVYCGVQGPNGRDVQDHACDSGAGCDGASTAGIGIDRRRQYERTVDHLGNTRHLHSHASYKYFTAWTTTHRGPRPGCESTSHRRPGQRMLGSGQG
jgi:hypothetical protein